MYESFYGFHEKPFSLLPDANFLFLSKRHRRVVNLLEYGTLTHTGFMVISGDVGAGKTTVIRHYLKHLDPNVTVGVITNPSKSYGTLMGWIASAFELTNPDNDNVKIYNAFLEFLLNQYAKGKRTVLIIDEAQNLSSEMLEELRMLSNVNNERDQLLQIILVGQPELLETLKRNDLRQFVQRIAVHYNLAPLTATETAAYIRHRLKVAGGEPDIFNALACSAIYHFSYGVPRLINQLCDQSLLYAFGEGKKRVSFHTILEVISDRNSSGLSPFRVPPPEQTEESLMAQMQATVVEVRKSLRKKRAV